MGRQDIEIYYILLISDIILFIYFSHYISLHWSFHNSVLVTCPFSFFFHILFDIYVMRTYCTTTFHLDLEVSCWNLLIMINVFLVFNGNVHKLCDISYSPSVDTQITIILLDPCFKGVLKIIGVHNNHQS